MTADAPSSNSDPRRAGRRATDPMLGEAARAEPHAETNWAGTNLPVVLEQKSRAKAEPAGPIEAQILGQDGQKRGLRGGKPVLDKARSAYLGAEWSGRADRRPRSGLITKTEI